MTDIEIPRPSSGDVVELIIEDHELFESLLRQLRDETGDREAARKALADALVAHGEAEEETVYNKLSSKDAITDDEAEHGKHEHAEVNEKLLALLECKGTDTQEFDDAVQELQEALTHHIGEEEQTILNPARTEVDDRTRQSIGRGFVTARNRLLDREVGTAEFVAQLVKTAKDEGLLEEGEGEK